jgi:DNA-directed RNA polymerase specialized sigma54-like protein
VTFFNKISGGCIMDGNWIDVEMYINVKEGYNAEKEQRELEKQQAQYELERKRNADNKAIIQTLKDKDLSKISSESKLNLMNCFIDQYNEKGFLSDKQKDIIYKWLTKKEKESYKKLYDELLSLK